MLPQPLPCWQSHLPAPPLPGHAAGTIVRAPIILADRKAFPTTVQRCRLRQRHPVARATARWRAGGQVQLVAGQVGAVLAAWMPRAHSWRPPVPGLRRRSPGGPAPRHRAQLPPMARLKPMESPLAPVLCLQAPVLPGRQRLAGRNRPRPVALHALAGPPLPAAAPRPRLPGAAPAECAHPSVRSPLPPVAGPRHWPASAGHRPAASPVPPGRR